MDDNPIALITDFGMHDAYVGVLKGVITRIAPGSPIIDLTHEVPRGDIRRAAFHLWQATPYFPEGTVFLCVVDPGVGTSRKSIAAVWEDRSAVGPDNGLFTYLLDRDGRPAAHELTESAYLLQTTSRTFHGRDIYAPAAAHLASGLPAAQLGPAHIEFERISIPSLAVHEGPRITGEIMHTDRFGNLVTSIGTLRESNKDYFLEPWLLQCAPARLPRTGMRLFLPDGAELRLRNTFADVAPGEPLAYIGSNGLIEIGVNQGSAEELLTIQQGQAVALGYKG